MICRGPELLSVRHEVEAFDCGSLALNNYLKRFALSNNAAGSARTYVCCAESSFSVLGYYSLCAGAVEKSSAPDRVGKGMPGHPIPVVLLARLAVNLNHQSAGIGKGLLKDALIRCATAADAIGIRAVLVHAKNQQAAAFYSRVGFVSSPTDPMHLMLLIKDIRNAL
jgi:GNAT superfamily N-acetyltransferase